MEAGLRARLQDAGAAGAGRRAAGIDRSLSAARLALGVRRRRAPRQLALHPVRDPSDQPSPRGDRAARCEPGKPGAHSEMGRPARGPQQSWSPFDAGVPLGFDAMKSGRIRVGVGGWSFAPWRDNFYPRGLPQAQELSFASRKLSAIEINATFYRTQTPESFRRWAIETPGDFVFSVKAHRLTTHRKLLAESKPAIDHFLSSGLLELGEKLGPIVWQFAPTKKFEAEDFAAFLELLPQE